MSCFSRPNFSSVATLSTVCCAAWNPRRQIRKCLRLRPTNCLSVYNTGLAVPATCFLFHPVQFRHPSKASSMRPSRSAAFTRERNSSTCRFLTPLCSCAKASLRLLPADTSSLMSSVATTSCNRAWAPEDKRASIGGKDARSFLPNRLPQRRKYLASGESLRHLRSQQRQNLFPRARSLPIRAPSKIRSTPGTDWSRRLPRRRSLTFGAAFFN